MTFLTPYRDMIGGDFIGYRNHVYRMVNFCLAFGELSEIDTEKVVIAGCFHDIGIWTAHTFDYLPPSIATANDYLRRRALESWSHEIVKMIDGHHKVRAIAADHGRLAEIFRKGDLVDFSLGIVKCGLSSEIVLSIKRQVPNEGFHKGLVKLAGHWFCRHPFNPVPVLKW